MVAGLTAASSASVSAGVLAQGTSSAGASRPSPASGYQPPVAPLDVHRGFEPPASVYGRGHRGVDLSSPLGTTVHAPATGTVAFAGDVAGRGVVVVTHRDGIRTEYEPVRASVVAGQSVVSGQPLGVIAGGHAGCPTGCLHWGARRGSQYFDPLLLLRPLDPIRLLPWASGRPTGLLDPTWWLPQDGGA